MTEITQPLLALLLHHHPALLSVEEVIRAITAGSDEFAERDTVEVGLRELVESGLAHRLGAFVFASHAAACFQQLEDG